jgi:hypothetical protein
MARLRLWVALREGRRDGGVGSGQFGELFNVLSCRWAKCWELGVAIQQRRYEAERAEVPGPGAGWHRR